MILSHKRLLVLNPRNTLNAQIQRKGVKCVGIVGLSLRQKKIRTHKNTKWKRKYGLLAKKRRSELFDTERRNYKL